MRVKKKRVNKNLYFLISVLTVSLFILFSSFAGDVVKALNSINSTSSGMNLKIWDTSDSSTKRSGWNIVFYANYSNSSKYITDANCTISFNHTGWGYWYNMSYNSTSPGNMPYWYETNFTYKGAHFFNINCSNSTASMNLSENFTIQNSVPTIRKEQGADWIDFDGVSTNHDTWSCTEDTICYFNFTNNVTDADLNDVLTYSVGSNTTLTNYSLNSTTGLLSINITHTNLTGNNKKIELTVRDTESLSQSGLLDVNIENINDAPVWKNLSNVTVNMSLNFYTVFYASDEEAYVPFTFNVTFESCTLANWSTRTNCTLFEPVVYNSTALSINFTGTRNDVGSYIVNFTVMDNGTGFGYANASSTVKLNITINNINAWPYFTYVCDNERNTTEDSFFSCHINATDIDETNNLTFFTSNYTWFLNETNATTTGFNSTLWLNFTPSDYQVGNWSINITIKDNSQSPQRINSTIISFYIENLNDSVSLFSIENFTGYTGNSYTIYANATDNDLLIPGPNGAVYNENLTFASNVSWVGITYLGFDGNISKISLTFVTNSSNIGNTSVNLSVTDKNNFSASSKIFTIQIVSNSPPNWSSDLSTNFSITEGAEFYLNLSGNVSDADANSVTFSYYNLSNTTFASFFTGVNSAGIVNLTPVDADVGFHQVLINATDGFTPTPLAINFTIVNVNDEPSFGAVGTTTVYEDNATTLDIWIYDEDFKITQTSYYAESLSINERIDGVNSNLFTFAETLAGGTSLSQMNLTIYSATFTPNKTDVGRYNITINATDNSGANASIIFTLIVAEVNHAPTMSNISNQTSRLGANFSLQINVTDSEDADTDAGGKFNFTYTFLSGSNFFNQTTFNQTTGLINITFNSSTLGLYQINVSVNDSSNLQSSKVFWLKIYDSPQLITYSPSAFYELENSSFWMNISGSHSVGDALTYSVYIDGILRNSTNSSGDGSSNVSLYVYLNFSDETTCVSGGVKNITLNISNDVFSNTTVLNLTVNHTNYPVGLTTSITNGSAGNSISYTLTAYFDDLDMNTNTCNNLTVNFTVTRMNSLYVPQTSGAFTLRLVNWTAAATPIFNISSTTNGTEYFQIQANDTYSVVKSNNFSVTLNVETIETQVQSSAGGGGSTLKPVSLKVIMPNSVEVNKFGHIVVPLTLYNNGKSRLSGINLESLATNFSAGISSENIKMYFDKAYFNALDAGSKQYANLTIEVDSKKTGDVEITINATVQNPVYNDWGKFLLKIKEANRTEVQEIILFTEELFVSNPECAELQEVLDDAKEAESSGDYTSAYKLAAQAVDSCKRAITQGRKSAVKVGGAQRNIIVYLSIITLMVLLLIFIFHLFNRMRIKKEEGNI